MTLSVAILVLRSFLDCCKRLGDAHVKCRYVSDVFAPECMLYRWARREMKFFVVLNI